ncbi:hypothetical protein E3C22_19440 [Jiella endophytica]|uniref:Uncharacterized protein n=1 Tax=Jiella endophytica TaxID=2558362 RepID=A0A4Y8RF43_9HYPH|nr:hypothetical protein [Jiella endophytica]TFF19843.1 hypothetical protein E3C22_19440 [Jiella endophytica]
MSRSVAGIMVVAMTTTLSPPSLKTLLISALTGLRGWPLGPRRIPDARRRGAGGKSPDWRRDPLTHPDLVRMDERQLADLPFSPFRVSPE